VARYIFVAGGVMSGIGKGVSTASIGRILQSKGYKVTAVKIDPYINVDAGTMNPTEHGEVFVTEDGVECDQDVGNYERFLDTDLSDVNYMTTGSVYREVIEKERAFKYEGKCVEVVPHIPEEVIRRIQRAGRHHNADFVLIEIGGTVGEYQNLLFLEAARMMRLRYPKHVLFVLVSYLPVPKMIGEMKTKPTQYAVRSLNMAGIQPDIIIARSVVPLDEPRKHKISIFCNMVPEDVISAPDVDSIYEVPINFEREDLSKRILKKFNLRSKKNNLHDWGQLVKTIKTVKRPITIGIVGKYFETGKFVLLDSYLSVIEAVKHASWFWKRKPKIVWLNPQDYETHPEIVKELRQFDGIIVPGGFGSRGVEGKILTAEYCSKNKIPYFGLCYGMQLATIEFARNVCKLKNAHTTEVNPQTPHPVIDVMLEQKTLLREKRYGGTMRLGAYPCRLQTKTINAKAYANTLNLERHRHRYEFNNTYREQMANKGLVFAGINSERDLVEIIELRNHPFFVGTQFHPELKSRPLHPHPLYKAFIKAAAKRHDAKTA
jgi:CTP synthase